MIILPELRKFVTFDEDIHREGEKTADPVLRIIGVAAVVKNPWAGQGYVEDLQPENSAHGAPTWGNAHRAFDCTGRIRSQP